MLTPLIESAERAAYDSRPHLSKDVILLQTLLAQRGFQLPPDGVFGHQTYKALKMFQISQGMAPSGVLDAPTWSLLRAWDQIREECLLEAESPAAVSAIRAALRETPLFSVTGSLEAAAARYGLKFGFLAGLACIESDLGRADYFLERNSLFGFNTFAPDHYNQRQRYLDHAASIEFAANYFKARYISPDGRWFMGSTLSGFGVFASSERPDRPDARAWIEEIAITWRALRNGQAGFVG